MMEDKKGRQRTRIRLWLALALVAALLAVLIVPPMVSISRYKNRITQLISASLGRPVRLSAVELRLLPRPGFVITDLTVAEDPAYGTEPVLHANTVTASIRLLSLWRGKLQLDRISADEASLNLVRTPEGRWNLDSLFRTAAAKSKLAAGGDKRPPLPFLEATDSRINFKSGAEKLPFSLLSTDVTLWQESPGEWRIRLRGEPMRTDVVLNQGDTGIVQLAASLHQAAELRQMPVNLDLEWRDAQLGQLTRLWLGSDAGWRGALTGELHLEGTADAAQIKTQLRAKNVHRSEFAPAEPMDFDANCALLYHFSSRSFENLACDSPLGDGRIHLTGNLPTDGTPKLTVEVDRIPAGAGLDALRTVRSNFGPGLEARGLVSGKIVYAEPDVPPPSDPAGQIEPKKTISGKQEKQKAIPAPEGPLTGSLIVDGFELSGGALSEPLRLPQLIFAPSGMQSTPAPQPSRKGKQPVANPVAAPSQPQSLQTSFAILTSGMQPLNATVQLGLTGYAVTLSGQAPLERVKELARAAGLEEAGALDALTEPEPASAPEVKGKETPKSPAPKLEPAVVDLSATGPWVAAEKIPLRGISPIAPVATTDAAAATNDAETPAAASRFVAAVTVRNLRWKPDFLANSLEIAQATVHIENGATRWDPVVFTYGPLKGTASLTLPAGCTAPQSCPPQFTLQFGALDAAALQAAILGAQEKGTMISELLARLRPSPAPSWPLVEGTVKADSLLLGSVTLKEPVAALRIQSTTVEITSLDAGLLGGQVHGGGELQTAATAQQKPSYNVEGRFEKLSPIAVGQLLGQHWSGGDFAGNGKIELSGFTENDLAATAHGALHFDWKHGAVAGAQVPAALSRFDQWSADAEIANGAITLKQSETQRGVNKTLIQASAVFGAPAKVSFAPAEPAQQAKK
jgi:uncharacterized protein involved in outer membrane biogenesis